MRQMIAGKPGERVQYEQAEVAGDNRHLYTGGSMVRPGVLFLQLAIRVRETNADTSGRSLIMKEAL